jgi:hypothetical protein
MEAVVPGRADAVAAIAAEIATLVQAQDRREQIARELEGARQERERADRHVAETVADRRDRALAR